MSKKFLAFDLGASNGRAIAGIFDGKKLFLENIHKFLNEYVEVNNSLHWDALRLFSEVKKGLSLFVKKYGGNLDGIGIDTWGVDFGLFDKHGKLIENPYCYRDKRNEGMVEEITGIIDRYEIYKTTGARIVPINTICQLYSMVKQNSVQLKFTDFFLMMPCLFNYFLTGEKFQEHSIITPTNLYDIRKEKYGKEFFKKLEIPVKIMLEVLKPGAIIGKLRKGIREESGLSEVPVILPATHDTASAVISVPAFKNKNWAFLSCGTWSILGIENDIPITTKESFKLDVTNASTAENKFMTIINITGLWIIQECKRILEKEGEVLDYQRMIKMAEDSKQFTAFIDVDDKSFFNPLDMPRAIINYCKNSNQKIPEDKGTIIRISLESLALKYKNALEKIEKLTGKKIEVLHIVGGGIQNKLLCQFTANALGILVITGPVEASATGNILMQMIGSKTIDSVSDGRLLLRKSLDLVEYKPENTDIWNEAYDKYRKFFYRRLK